MKEETKVKIYLKGVDFFGNEDAFAKWLFAVNPEICKIRFKRCPIDYSWTWIEKEVDKLIKAKS